MTRIECTAVLVCFILRTRLINSLGNDRCRFNLRLLFCFRVPIILLIAVNVVQITGFIGISF